MAKAKKATESLDLTRIIEMVGRQDDIGGSFVLANAAGYRKAEPSARNSALLTTTASQTIWKSTA